MSSVLFVDDDEESARALIRSLSRIGFNTHCETAASRELSLSFIRTHKPSAVVLDLELDETVGPMSGLELLSEILKLDSTVRVIVLTGHSAEEFGIEALRRGAGSFLQKPANSEHLKALLDDAQQFTALRRRIVELENERTYSIPAVGLSSRNADMQRIFGEVRFAGSMAQPLLILGETGTGKGVVARAIHELSRPGKPFVRAQPTYGNFDLVQSELFGHERGAFTGALHERKGLVEEADGGTLFLDEIDSLPEETQVLLLNVLQEKKFRRLGSNRERASSFRLIAAGNRPRAELERRLRPDLFHRIAHHIIEIPPLRERKEDIELLSHSLLREISDREKLRVNQIAPEAMQKLRSHSWPGNIRELAACIQQSAYRARFNGRGIISSEDIPLSEAGALRLGAFREQVNDFEAQLLRRTLLECQGNVSEAGRRLGLERTQLKRLLKRYQILPEPQSSLGRSSKPKSSRKRQRE